MLYNFFQDEMVLIYFYETYITESITPVEIIALIDVSKTLISDNYLELISFFSLLPL